jgi:hypothetical protein
MLLLARLRPRNTDSLLPVHARARDTRLTALVYAVSLSRGLARGRTQDSTRVQRLTFPCLGYTDCHRLLEL